MGKWEGDTLVLDSISFVDSTWLGGNGLIPERANCEVYEEGNHTNQMRH